MQCMTNILSGLTANIFHLSHREKRHGMNVASVLNDMIKANDIINHDLAKANCSFGKVPKEILL